MVSPKSLYEWFKVAGCEMDHHESDLYVKVDAVAARILRDWNSHPEQRIAYNQFKADDGSGLWFDLPFQYDPFWQR